MTTSKTLIVGGDSKVGQALADSLRCDGNPVIVTTRRQPQRTDQYRLDLCDCASWEAPADVEVAVLAAAQTNMEACRLNPAGTAEVNVHGLLTVAEKLQRRGVFLVYLSSSTVFDGVQPFPRPGDPVCPLNEYGRQKAAAEQGLRYLGDGVAVVRLTKILETVTPLLSSWQQELRQGRAIAPFADMSIAPIPLAYAVLSLRRLIDARRGGIWQVSADRDITYAEIARRAVELAGLDEWLVRPIAARDSGKIKERFPEHTAMNCDALRETFGLRPPLVESSLDALLRQTWEGACLAAARAA